MVITNLRQDLLILAQDAKVPDNRGHHTLGLLHYDVFHRVIPIGVENKFDRSDLLQLRPVEIESRLLII